VSELHGPNGDRSRLPATDVFEGREVERHPERFVGLTVTLIGKEAIRWENTTITGLDGRELLLSGGEQVTQIFSDAPVRKPIAGRNSRVPCWEIARGSIADAVRRSVRRFTECGKIRVHLAAGGDQPWQDPGMRGYAREVAKGLAADLVEIEPLGDGWLFAGQFESTGPWATWQTVTGIQTPYGICRARERQINNQGGASRCCPMCGVRPRVMPRGDAA
jgi:hypothetical protein